MEQYSDSFYPITYMSIDTILQSALQQHQAGQFQEAEKSYKKLLNVQPDHFYALHYLGILYFQTRNYRLAIHTIEKALIVNPNDANAHYNLGTVYKAAGQTDDAIRCFQESLRLGPDNRDALVNMGIAYLDKKQPDKAIPCFHKALRLQPQHLLAYYNLGVAYTAKGQTDDAIGCFQKALQLDPGLSAACYYLGLLHNGKGQTDPAIGYFQKSIQLNPQFADSYYQLGLVFQETGQPGLAADSYQKAVQQDPRHFAAYNNLGVVLTKTEQLEEALACYRKALQINPDSADIHNNIGDILQKKGDRERAVGYYQKALQLDPNLASAHNNLGNVFVEKGNFDEAVWYYRRAIELEHSPESYTNLGIAFCHQGLLQQAILCFHDALAADPEYAGAYISLGTVFKDKGQPDEAEKHLRRALDIKPDPHAYSNLLLYMIYNPRYTPQELFSEHAHFARQFADLASRTERHENSPAPSRRLKIGYVSPDFKRHPVACFIEQVLAAHDREKHEIFCYSDVVIPDLVTERIRNTADEWRTIAGLSDEKTAELIRKDGIDLLVDLAGHTAGNRMLLFARRPAPVQVTWIGYPSTTGLATMDYKIVDRYTDPPEMTEQFYTEKLIRMPAGFLCYAPESNGPEVGPLPGLSTGHITFGSLNTFAKVSSRVIEWWATILKKVPGSRLVMKAKSLSDWSVREYVLDLFRQEAVNPGLIDLLGWQSSTSGHLETYNRIDIALDTFPYNGTTTTCEALWMGVPVITLAGNTHASRVGTSLLSNTGLPLLIAETPEEYVGKAIHLANDLKELQSLREHLRAMLVSSPLCNAGKFISDLEDLYRRMWTNWCASK